MENDKRVRLTSAEVSQLWATYMNESAIIPVITYFLEKVKDVHIQPVLEYALDLAHAHVNKIAGLFRDEGYPVPYGFKLEEDVDLTAPR